MASDEEEELTIGDTAGRTGLSAHTLRYYERTGLVSPIRRGQRGERRYAHAGLEWIAFLQRLRATGMPIREMARFAELRRRGAPTIDARRALLEGHRQRLAAQIDELKRGLVEVEAKLERLKSGIDNHGPREG